MANGEVVAYNVASLLCALFVLERGADVFIDHTAIIAQRTRIPQPAIALLTAGAEWEELAVVVISIARNRPSLAIGNVVGSTIANILGAFSLGLIFHKNPTRDQVLFEPSSTIYSVALLVVTAMASALLAFGHRIDWRAAGGAFVGLFAVYLVSISYLIAKGITKAPEELSDSDSGSADTDDDDGYNAAEDDNRGEREIHSDRPFLSNSSITSLLDNPTVVGEDAVFATSTERQVANSGRKIPDASDAGNTSGPSIPSDSAYRDVSDATITPTKAAAETEETLPPSTPRRHSSSHRYSLYRRSTRSSATAAPIRPDKLRSVAYHIATLGIGFVAIVLSGYVLSNAASNLVDEFGISDVLAGVVVLSIATTIPEKFIAVLSGYKGHMDIMLANTVGSNIFLLTLCIGIVWVTTGGTYEGGDVVPAEIAVMFGSTVALAVAVLFQGRFARIIGVVMLMNYIAFIVLEFMVIHKV